MPESRVRQLLDDVGAEGLKTAQEPDVTKRPRKSAITSKSAVVGNSLKKAKKRGIAKGAA